MRRICVWQVVGIAVLLASVAGGADWTRFRGPNGSGVSDEKGVPTTWSATENVVWKTELPGAGASSPITVGDRVFVTCFREMKDDTAKTIERILVCVDRRDGRQMWYRTVQAKPNEDRYTGFLQSHGFASSTPTTDGERVYVLFGKSGVVAYDLEGQQLWQTDVGSGSAMMGWGSGTSPIVYKNMVIVTASAESKSLIALDGKTGKEVWKTPADGFAGSWTTPVLVDVDGQQELVISVPYELWGFNPDTGELLWFCEGILEGAICPSVVAKDGIVYAIGGRGGGAVAVKAGGRDDVNKTHIVWRKSVGSYVTSPVIVGEHLYWVHDNGIAVCMALKTGETVYRQRLDGARQLYASVTAADGKLYAVTRENGTFVLAAKPEFEKLAHNKLDDAGTCNASPTVSRGQLLLRSDRFLYCLGAK